MKLRWSMVQERERLCIMCCVRNKCEEEAGRAWSDLGCAGGAGRVEHVEWIVRPDRHTVDELGA